MNDDETGGRDGALVVHDQRLAHLENIIKKHRSKFPEEAAPNVLVCGKLGSGKTTTINTLFGRRVGHVGHFSRGTDKDEVYVWEAHTENINIVDLPGLGDRPDKDKEFREIYKTHVPHADGFIVVVTPPRPAEDSTLKTVRLLLSCGVPSGHIIFAFNKLSDLDYDGDNGLRRVKLDGLSGPATDDDLAAVQMAKDAFIDDLRSAFPRATFAETQIQEFDSKSGWNLHKVLRAVIETLPYQTLARLRRVAREAHRAAVSREKQKLRAEHAKLEEKKRAVEEAERRLHEATAGSGSRAAGGGNTFVNLDLRQLRDEVANKKAEVRADDQRLEKREGAIREFDHEMVTTERTIGQRIYAGVEKVIEGIKEVKREVVDLARSAKKKVLGWFGWN